MPPNPIFNEQKCMCGVLYKCSKKFLHRYVVYGEKSLKCTKINLNFPGGLEPKIAFTCYYKLGLIMCPVDAVCNLIKTITNTDLPTRGP